MNRLSGAVSERGAPRSLAATSANLSPWGFRCATRSSIRCHLFYCLACRGSVGLVVGTPRIIEPHCSPEATLSGRCYQRRREPVARARMAHWHQFQLRGCSGYPGAELYPKLVQVLSVRNARASADQVRVSMSSGCREQATRTGRPGAIATRPFQSKPGLWATTTWSDAKGFAGGRLFGGLGAGRGTRVMVSLPAVALDR